MALPEVVVPNSANRWLCQQYNKNLIMLHDIVVGVSVHQHKYSGRKVTKMM
jgi:hypothetical protein